MTEHFNVVSYLNERTNALGERELVVRQVRLRGEPSFGLVVRPDDASWPVGTGVREHYGIGKLRPPVKFSAGDSEPNHPLFQRYTVAILYDEVYGSLGPSIEEGLPAGDRSAGR
jgi:hypothetical protein